MAVSAVALLSQGKLFELAGQDSMLIRLNMRCMLPSEKDSEPLDTVSQQLELDKINTTHCYIQRLVSNYLEI